MKLVNFKQKQDYLFALTFENGETKETDLQTSIGNYVSPEFLNTARKRTNGVV